MTCSVFLQMLILVDNVHFRLTLVIVLVLIILEVVGVVLSSTLRLFDVCATIENYMEAAHSLWFKVRPAYSYLEML